MNKGGVDNILILRNMEHLCCYVNRQTKMPRNNFIGPIYMMPEITDVPYKSQSLYIFKLLSKQPVSFSDIVVCKLFM